MNSNYSKSSRPLTDLQSCIINTNQSFGDASCKLIWILSMIWTNSDFRRNPPWVKFDVIFLGSLIHKAHQNTGSRRAGNRNAGSRNAGDRWAKLVITQFNIVSILLGNSKFMETLVGFSHRWLRQRGFGPWICSLLIAQLISFISISLTFRFILFLLPFLILVEVWLHSSLHSILYIVLTCFSFLPCSTSSVLFRLFSPYMSDPSPLSHFSTYPILFMCAASTQLLLMLD